LPPLVHWSEIDKLRNLLEDVYEGKRFILQGGDCAEMFKDCTEELISIKLKIMIQMSLVIQWVARMPTVRIGRIAGQYSKPRTSATEFVTVDGVQKEVTSFRGDSVNDNDVNRRTPDPARLLQAYFYSSATLNFIRSLINSGFASLRESNHWQVDYYIDPVRREEYERMVAQLLGSLEFCEICGISLGEQINSVNFFTSHEALLLPYESGLTREYCGKSYATSAHFLWIGDRTRELDNAHVEFCRGVENPVGVKVGPSMDLQELKHLCKRLNPANIPGKLVLITRLGAANVTRCLPNIINAVKEAGVKVVWQCDPMHGNTLSASNKLKTRNFETILEEFALTFQIHQSMGSFLGGVHFELTGENVTECLGGPQELLEADLPKQYDTLCDPRLNYAQSMEIAFKVSKLLAQSKKSSALK